MDPFVGIKLQHVDLQQVERLVTDAVPESLHLDYKEELAIDSREGKKEFLRDVTAFANAQGGLLAFGIQEDRDAHGRPSGVPAAAPGITLANKDTTMLSLEHLLRDGVDERLPAYELQAISLTGDKYVILLRVSPSLRSPHMVVLGGERRFFIRVNGGKQDMSTAQLRDAVLRTQSIEGRVRAFVANRLDKLTRLAKGRPYWVLHVVPLVRDNRAVDVTDPTVVDRLTKMGAPSGGNPQHCLEGYKVHWRDGDGHLSHGLTFRDGSIEFFDQASVSSRGDDKWFAYVDVHKRIATSLQAAIGVYRDGLLNPPLAVCLTLAGLDDFRLPDSGGRDLLPGPADPISADPVVVNDVECDANELLKSFMDVVWNAFGQARCPAYDDDGNYVGYRR